MPPMAFGDRGKTTTIASKLGEKIFVPAVGFLTFSNYIIMGGNSKGDGW